MTYRLQTTESVPQEIKRIAKEQLEKAIEELSNLDELGVDEAVHQVRKRLKKIRAILRLVRDQLGETSYKANNTRFRDLARRFADLRDSQVRLETLNHLSDQFSETVKPDAFEDINRELAVDYRQAYQSIWDDDILTSVKNQLKDAKKELEDWAIAADGWEVVDSSLKRVYKRGYKGLNQVLSEPSVENLHQWRKRVKYLRYQLRILRPIWSAIVKEWIKQTHDLSAYLGEDHDLAMLKAFIFNQPDRFPRSPLADDQDNSVEILMNLIDYRREELQTAAIFLGRRIYTEKPKRLMTRLQNYWQIWQEETQQSQKLGLS